MESTSVRRVPDRKMLSLASRQSETVRTECEALDLSVAGKTVSWRIERKQFLTRDRVPYADGFVVGGRGQKLTIGAESQVANVSAVPFKNAGGLKVERALEVPQ